MATQDKAAKITDGDQLDDGYFNDTAGIIDIEAGENITAGNVVYFKLSDGKAYISDLGTQDDIRANGIALTTVSSGADVTVQTAGVYTTTGLTDKAVQYLGVAGAVVETKTAVKIGVALSATLLSIEIVQDDKAEVGTIKAWHKTFGTADSGTTDATTANKLEESGQNFTSTVEPGMVIFNSTDNTFTYVTAVDSDTVLSVANDIFTSGEGYTIYKTRQMSAFWVECEGSALTDAESVYDGETLPALNGTTDGTKKFLRGVDANTTGGLGSSVSHTHTYADASCPRGSLSTCSPAGGTSTDAATHIPPYMEIVWVMKIK